MSIILNTHRVNIDPTKALENLESGETLAKSLGKAKRWIEVLQEGGGGGGSAETVSQESFPCASGYSNFSTNSIVFKKGTVVTFAIILTINSGTTCTSHSLIGTISSEFRPPSTNVLPGTLAYEDANTPPTSCTVNVNSDGTVRYYGIDAPAGRHICINGSLFSIIIKNI